MKYCQISVSRSLPKNSPTTSRVERQVELPLRDKEVLLDCEYRLDLLVNGVVIVEVKAVNETAPIQHT